MDVKWLDALNYSFKDQSLIETALRHKSAGNPHNERLEFLGDAILAQIISEYLYETFPEAQEGQMTRMRSQLVNGVHLSEQALVLKLDTQLTLSSAEMRSGGYRRQSVLENAFEAIIGAIYLDGGYTAARDFVLTNFSTSIAECSPQAFQIDAKTRLQEHLQKYQHPLPQYAITQTVGAEHDQMFTVECFAEGVDIRSTGEGRSKKAAEQAAAEAVLKQIEQNKNHEK